MDAALALNRFGLGPRPGDLALVGGDPRGALAAELSEPGIAELAGDAFLAPPAIAAAIRETTVERDRVVADIVARNDAPDLEAAIIRAVPKSAEGRIYNDEVAARVARYSAASIGFAERLTTFWYNHFAIEARRGSFARGAVGAFEREAIRPHVLGRFEDMLLAATRHPAMLVYLDNAESVGPNSINGLENGKGINENHARELLELHTLGAGSGYSQADVTALAKVLTGWTAGHEANVPETFGRHYFNARVHEPGAQTILGRSYGQEGVEQGEAVLRDLARGPATATYIARKIAVHFVADAPPRALLETLAAAFMDTGGDLRAVALALIASEEASAPATKLKSPQEYLWSALRAFALTIPHEGVMRILNTLGQPLWSAGSPRGYADDVATWLAPDAMMDRLEIADALAYYASAEIDPAFLVDAILGPLASAETRQVIAAAGSRQQALSLFLMSPEFQRR